MPSATPFETAKQWFQQTRNLSPSDAFWEGNKAGADGNLLSLPFIAYEVGTAQRGEALATATGRVAGLCTLPVATGLTCAILASIPGLNVAASPFIATILASFPNTMLEDKVISGIRGITNTARNIQRLEFGGRYEDSSSAQAIRQRSIKDMNGAMQSSRRYLGMEGALMHR